jgi:hypothetical protein
MIFFRDNVADELAEGGGKSFANLEYEKAVSEADRLNGVGR